LPRCIRNNNELYLHRNGEENMFDKSMTTVRPFKLALLALAIGAAAQASAASTTASASATVITPINVSSTGSLSFGKIAASASPGSITISTSGTRSVSGGVTGSSTTSAVKFDIIGEPSATYTIDTSATTANLTSGSDTMALALVADFTGGGATAGTQSGGTLDGTGKQSLYVGGTLTVGANQAAGAYTGTVSVAVAYN
jgi:spore coat protein U-like protein